MVDQKKELSPLDAQVKELEQKAQKLEQDASMFLANYHRCTAAALAFKEAASSLRTALQAKPSTDGVAEAKPEPMPQP